jgi:hypothetical protein
VGRVELVVRWLAAGEEKGLSYSAEFTGIDQEGRSELRAREALVAHLTVGQQLVSSPENDPRDAAPR